MNSSLNDLNRSVGSQPEEAVKFRLRPTGSGHPSPYIEHWVLQLFGVHPEKIDDPDVLQTTVQDAVGKLGLTSVGIHSHFFGPGVSTVAILSESHLSVHTWPELGYVHLDIVTCVKKLTENSLHAVLDAAFHPERIQLNQFEY